MSSSSPVDHVASPVSLSTAAGSQISFEKDGENYKCSICGKAFGYKNGLIRHVRLTHDKERPFQCDICHRRFGYKNILLEHQNIHFGIKPYACNLCDKKFAARSNLVQHRLIHRKPYCCRMCNRRFDKEVQLQRHLLTCQGEALQCSICNYAASNQTSLNAHIFEAHPPQYYDTRDKNRVDLAGGDSTAGSLSIVSTCSANDNSSGGSGIDSVLSYNLQLSTETESMRKIDNICSQLASRSNSTTPSNDSVVGGATIKQEQPSPSYDSQPVFPVGISVSNNERCFVENQQKQYSNNGNSSNGSSSGVTSEAACRLTVSRLDNTSNHRSSSPPHPALASTTIDEMMQVVEVPATPDQPVSNRCYTVPSPRDLIPSNIADSTSSLSEMLSMLQNLIQKSQELEPSSSGGFSVAITPRKSTKDVATQFATPIDGVPLLEDTLAYYMSQGKIYKCNHCGIIFQERGMYFLHNSLHGAYNPWECSICHKVCADKNDFNLHFVNQQHV
ncbi:DNA-binding protein Ikaros [Octopus sinensis]|uniref:DNA-binding protein Ikaros n=1 Tax=Octopus sinensis TaxID=2607531 RepID=A0A6P7TRZ0_9MOLL|nr:DNA-binding protein Ikaros [Octopus sinensis]XP_029651681.1 DNA-binding protein Ikaros [Octopus sinensis]